MYATPRAPRSGLEPGVEAVTADIAMHSATGPTFLMCCTVIGLLLRLRPNWGAFGLGVVLHGTTRLQDTPSTWHVCLEARQHTLCGGKNLPYEEKRGEKSDSAPWQLASRLP